jgi:hypothetical protein
MQMKMTKLVVFSVGLIIGVAAWAQEYPLAEAGFDYSYARYAPSAAYTKGHSLNGGGGTFVYNISEYLGLKADLQGYGSNHTEFIIPPGISPNFPHGGTGNVQGNLFTYLFGPQIKVRVPKIQPFAHLLFGGAHSNVYGNAFKTICQPIVGGCAFSKLRAETPLQWGLAAVWISRLASTFPSGPPRSITCSLTSAINSTTEFKITSGIPPA